MYGLPLDTDLRFLEERALQQVCIGANEAILNFDDGVSLTIQTDVAHMSPEGNLIALYRSILPSVPTLVGLINATVKNARAMSPGTLVLRFSTGDVLEIYDSSTEYESYQVWHGSDVIIV